MNQCGVRKTTTGTFRALMLEQVALKCLTTFNFFAASSDFESLRSGAAGFEFRHESIFTNFDTIYYYRLPLSLLTS